jgi:hypothetical protein
MSIASAQNKDGAVHHSTKHRICDADAAVLNGRLWQDRDG